MLETSSYIIQFGWETTFANSCGICLDYTIYSTNIFWRESKSSTDTSYTAIGGCHHWVGAWNKRISSQTTYRRRRQLAPDESRMRWNSIPSHVSMLAESPSPFRIVQWTSLWHAHHQISCRPFTWDLWHNVTSLFFMHSSVMKDIGKIIQVMHIVTSKKWFSMGIVGH